MQKLDVWRNKHAAYPNQVKNSHCAKQLLAKYDGLTKPQLADNKVEVKLSGRMMTQRLMGKASFAHVQDGSGEQLQWYFRSQDIGADQFEFYKTLI